MNDKYQEIIECLETPKLFEEISKATGIVRGSLHLMIARLLESEKIMREKVSVNGSRQCFYKYTRLVDRVTRAEVIHATNYKKIVDMRNTSKNIHPLARVIAERHVPKIKDEKKKSPRTYIGCSFSLAGW